MYDEYEMDVVNHSNFFSTATYYVCKYENSK